ncbi:MAG: PH domain-containing protein [Bacilli bacterium]|nr:PH domain-containing protein [Bacilli bacterium]MDD4808650.1 PH domain-containing protein [Bacilli bacterium]
MAFLKYKELTQYFNFFKEIEFENVPGYIKDYVVEEEKILAIYKTYRDHGVFTDHKIILFDQRGTGNVKEITIVPYCSVSSCAIKFYASSAYILLYMDSGYPLRLKFVRLKPEDKKRLRILYNKICEEII